jgi:hypothetical protein
MWNPHQASLLFNTIGQEQGEKIVNSHWLVDFTRMRPPEALLHPDPRIRPVAYGTNEAGGGKNSLMAGS